VEPTHQTVDDFVTEWLRAMEPTVRPSTFDSYSRNMRNHVVPHIGNVRLTRVDAGVLNGLYATLLASGRRPSSRTGKGYSAGVLRRAQELRAEGVTLAVTAETLRAEFGEAHHITKDTLASLLRRAGARDVATVAPGLDPRTVSYVHTILHRALNDAVRWGRLARNPADAADPPRVGHRSDGVHAWDAETLRAFLEASRNNNDRLSPLWVLLATTGMRRGEALGLRWADLDLDACRARVVTTIIQTSSRVVIGEPKTSSGRRALALDAATAGVLRDHRRRMLEERLLVGPDFEDNGLVFHQPNGEYLRPDAVSAAFLRRVGTYGLPRIPLHGLRHTWATLASNAASIRASCRSASATQRSPSRWASTATSRRRCMTRPRSSSPTSFSTDDGPW
jgi:integrase